MDQYVFVGKGDLSFKEYENYRLTNWINYTKSLNYYSVKFLYVDNFDFFIDQELYTLLNAFFLRDKRQSLDKLGRFKGQCFGDDTDYIICMILQQEPLFSHFKELVKVQTQLADKINKSNLKEVKALRTATSSDWNRFITCYGESVVTEEKRQDNFKFASRRFLFKMKNIKRDSRVVSVYSLLLLVIYVLFISPLIWSKADSQNGNTGSTIKERTIMQVDTRTKIASTEEDNFLEWEINTLANQADEEWGCAYNSETGQTMLYDQSGQIVRVKYPNHFLGSWSYIYSSETGETTFYNKSNFVFKIKHNQKMLSASEFDKLVDVVKSYKRGDYSKYGMIRSSSPFLNNMEEQKKSNQSLVKPPAQASNARAQLLQKNPVYAVAMPKQSLSVKQPRMRGIAVAVAPVNFEIYDLDNPKKNFHQLTAEHVDYIKTVSGFDEAFKVIDLACPEFDVESRRLRALIEGRQDSIEHINDFTLPDCLRNDETLNFARTQLGLDGPYTQTAIDRVNDHLVALRLNPRDENVINDTRRGLKRDIMHVDESVPRKLQLLKFLMKEEEMKTLQLQTPHQFANLIIGHVNHCPSSTQANRYQREFNDLLNQDINQNHENIVNQIASRNVVSPNYVHYGLKTANAYPANSPAKAIYCAPYHTVARTGSEMLKLYVVKLENVLDPNDVFTKVGVVNGKGSVDQRFDNDDVYRKVPLHKFESQPIHCKHIYKMETMILGRFQNYSHYKYGFAGASECLKSEVHEHAVNYAKFLLTEVPGNSRYDNVTTETCIKRSLPRYNSTRILEENIVSPRFDNQFLIRNRIDNQLLLRKSSLD